MDDVDFYLYDLKTKFNKINPKERKIKYNQKYYTEIFDFCDNEMDYENRQRLVYYPEHNDRYLKQCYYNLEEKADRGIISEEEWEPIQNFWNKFIKEKSIEENDE